MKMNQVKLIRKRENENETIEKLKKRGEKKNIKTCISEKLIVLV